MTMYYVYSLPVRTTFNINTLKEDVQSYMKFKSTQIEDNGTEIEAEESDDNV